MNPIAYNLLSRHRRAWLGFGLCALGLGCGSAPASPLGEREQPFTAPEGDDDAEQANACEAGTPAQGPLGDECQVIAQGLCFTTNEAACACAGCALEQCLIAESFPAQAFCQSDEDPGSSDPDAPVTDGPTSGGTHGSAGAGSPSNPGCGEPEQSAPSQPPSEPACGGGRLREPNGNAPCDFVVSGYCFDDAETACACAGCADACRVQESYPAQIACQ
jgi:hypothetical protein